MKRTKHSPEPWAVSGNQYIVADDAELVADCYREAKHDTENAARIVACVNACKGINPEAVPDLITALESVKAVFDDPDGTLIDLDIGAIRAALTKATGKQ